MNDTIMAQQRPRDAGVDMFRYLMALAVVAIHALPHSSPSAVEGASSASIFEQVVHVLLRCAVPFFFVVPGFYLKSTRNVGELVWRPVARVAPIYLAWLTIYYLATPISSTGPWPAPASIALLTGGSGFHLWFLPALMFGLIGIGLSLKMLGPLATLMLALGAALIGPIYVDYAAILSDGSSQIPWYFKPLLERQMSAPILIFMGWWLSKRPAPTVLAASGLLLSLALAQVAEAALLTGSRGRPGIDSYDVTIMTIPFGGAVFQMARAVNGSILSNRLQKLGELSLCIYLVHLLVMWCVEAIQPMDKGSILWLIIAVISTVVAMALTRLPIVKRFTS